MAKLIPTDANLPAVDLRYLRSADILYLDDEIHSTVAGPHPNGGFAEIFLEVKKGILGLIRFVKTSKPENRH